MPISEDGAWAIAKTSVICPQISGVESSVDLKIVIIKDSNRFDRRYGAEMHNKRMKVGTTRWVLNKSKTTTLYRFNWF